MRLYMQPTVIFSFFVAGALRYRCTNVPVPWHKRTQYHSHNRYHQFYLCNGNRNATVVRRSSVTKNEKIHKTHKNFVE
jgi:hypothetical protein